MAAVTIRTARTRPGTMGRRASVRGPRDGIAVRDSLASPVTDRTSMAHNFDGKKIALALNAGLFVSQKTPRAPARARRFTGARLGCT